MTVTPKGNELKRCEQLAMTCPNAEYSTSTMHKLYYDACPAEWKRTFSATGTSIELTVPHSLHPDAPDKKGAPSLRADARNKKLGGSSAKKLAVHGQVGKTQSWARDADRVRRVMGSTWELYFPNGTGPEALFDVDDTVGERFLRNAPNGSHFSVATDFMLKALRTLKMREEDNLEWESYVHTDTTYGLCSSMYTTTSCMFSKRAGVSKTVFVTFSRYVINLSTTLPNL
jgi:hypothetical protein